MHNHMGISMEERHRGRDGLETTVSVDVTIQHDHGPIAEGEDHDHAITVAIVQDGETVTLRKAVSG